MSFIFKRASNTWNYSQKYAQNVVPPLERMMNFLGTTNFTYQEKKREKLTWMLILAVVVFTSNTSYFLYMFPDMVHNYFEKESMN